MNLDNLGPIVLFFIYMAISAWSKQNKARQKAKASENSGPAKSHSTSKPAVQVGGILDQLKKELFEIDEEPLTFQQAEPEYQPEVEEEAAAPPVEVDKKRSFMEGSPDHTHSHLPITVDSSGESSNGQTLEELLEPYSKIEQGIILHEILGKPRARQSNQEWFHKS